jgi:hypothetical protein
MWAGDYAFKHELVRDAPYQSLLTEQRTARIAGTASNPAATQSKESAFRPICRDCRLSAFSCDYNRNTALGPANYADRLHTGKDDALAK